MENGSRNSILCPNCRRLISGDERQCPYCGTANPGSWWKNNAWTRGAFQPEGFIRWIIAVNVAMFLLSLLVNPRLTTLSLNPFAFLSPDNRSLILLGATGTVPIERFGRWWTLISASYLHGGILHLLFNMAALSQIGPLILQEYGGYRMFVIYTLGGVAGYIVSLYFGVAFTLGASAAVCGLIGAALYYGKSRGGTYGQAIFQQVGGWVMGLFVFGLFFPGINNWAHGGGIIGGVLVGAVLGYSERRRENLLHKTLAGLCAGATALILLWAVVSTLFGLA